MTTTKANTLGEVLTRANPVDLPDALRKVDLGNLLKVKEYDSGTITGTSSVDLAEDALLVISARIVTATTASKVGTYMVTPDTGITRLTASTSGVIGLATLGANKRTITFEATDATRVLVKYIAAPTIPLSDKFDPSTAS